jgi:hypothetical protein
VVLALVVQDGMDLGENASRLTTCIDFGNNWSVRAKLLMNYLLLITANIGTKHDVVVGVSVELLGVHLGKELDVATTTVYTSFER